MNDIRSSFASLSGSLLARKGGAKPAMRPRPLGTGMLDDLGWDDMGHVDDHPSEHVPSSIAALTPAPKLPRSEEPPVHAQQRAIAERFEAPEPETVGVAEPMEEQPSRRAERKVKAALPSAIDTPKRLVGVGGKKAAFTLRLDTGRHLRLRLATAVTGQSAQALVTAALDRFLASLPEVEALADRLPAQPATSN